VSVPAEQPGWKPLTDPAGRQPIRLPTSPFGRLAVAHAAATASDAMVTLALAGSLFFSVSVDAAGARVLLYLVLSLAPFAVVAPLIGPWIDRFSGGRRWVVMGSCLLRASLALVMAGLLDSLLLFPFAFAMLVVSKTYSVARASLVPDVVRNEDQLVKANARLSLIAGLAALAGQLPAVTVNWLFDETWVLRLAAVCFIGSGVLSWRIRLARPADHDRSARTSINAGAHKPTTAMDPSDRRWTPAVRVAVAVMAILRAQVGLLLFVVLFSFRRDDVSTVWYGVVGGAAAASTAIGAALSPSLRNRFREDVILAGIPTLGGVAAVLCTFNSSPLTTAVLAAGVGLGNAAGRVAFDAVLQRDVPTTERSEAFGRVETIFQLAWVAGALLPVAISFPRWFGALVLVGAAVAAVVIGVIGEPALLWLRGSVRNLRPAWWQSWWKRPIRPETHSNGDSPN
jgi:MFS family permease